MALAPDRGSEPVASTFSLSVSASVLPGLCLPPVSRCLIFFLSLENGSRTSMLAWVGAVGGPHSFDRFGAHAQHELGAMGRPVGPKRVLAVSFVSCPLLTLVFTQTPTASGFASRDRSLSSNFHRIGCRFSIRLRYVNLFRMSAPDACFRLPHVPRASLSPLHLTRSPDLASILGSDALLGCVFPVAIALLSLKLFPLTSERHGVAPDVSPLSHTNHTRRHRNYPRERCVLFSTLRSGGPGIPSELRTRLGMPKSWGGWRGPSRQILLS